MADWTYEETCELIIELQQMQLHVERKPVSKDAERNKKVLHYLAAAEGDLTQVRELLEGESKPESFDRGDPSEVDGENDRNNIDPFLPRLTPREHYEALAAEAHAGDLEATAPVIKSAIHAKEQNG